MKTDPALQKPRLAIIDGIVTVTSLVVANAFDRPHNQVLQTIGDLLGGLPDKAWCNQHFQYRDLAGDPMYRLTRDAFVMLVATFISFTDRKATVESLYLNAFDVLEGGGKSDAKTQLPDLPPQAKAAGQHSVALPALNGEGVRRTPLEKLPISQRFRVFAGVVQDYPTLLVDARDLHASIAIGRDYPDWIRCRIVHYGFVIDQDYVEALPAYPAPPGRPGPRVFYLTIDMAKDLAAIEGSRKGKMVKRYLQTYDERLQSLAWLGLGMIAPFPRRGGVLEYMWDSGSGRMLELPTSRPFKARSAVKVSEPAKVTPSPSTDAPPVFQFDSRTVRTSVEGDEVWFVAKDVFETLDLVWKGSDSLKPIPEDWRVLRSFRTPLENQHGSQGTQEKDLICLNFKAVCKVAFRSNKPEADRFTNWAAEVIDTLRKTGRYEVPKAAPVPTPANPPGQLNFDDLNFDDPAFFLTLFNALGRNNGKITLLVQLVKMGGLDKWITTTLREIAAASNGKISRSNVNYNAKRLMDEGLIDRTDGGYGKFYVSSKALRALIKRHMSQNTDGMLALQDDPVKSDGAGHGGGATLH